MPGERVQAEVTQADRDAARLIGDEVQRQLAEQGFVGTYSISDTGVLVQAFARHRIAAVREALAPTQSEGNGL